jgi:putative tricarboxylic transport membrane protein
MLESLSRLAGGFSVALQPVNLLYCFAGVFVGTFVGVLPGIGPAATLALLLPITFGLDPVSAIIMLCGVCYGAMYGGSTTSILLNIPGEASSVMTCVDGYRMALNGRAGPALGIAAFASFIAGTFSLVGLMFVAPILGEFALRFGPPEYFALAVFGLSVVAYLSRTSIVKSLMMVSAGIILGCIGLDPISATPRLTFGSTEFAEGLALPPVVMGLFGLSEVLSNVGKGSKKELFGERIRGLLPNRDDWRSSAGPITRGASLGFVTGLLPGVGTIVPQFLSYALERRLSNSPEKFGTGAIEGVASAEACNNAAMGASFIPLFSLGIPSNAMTAMLLGALMIHGLTPGPLLIQDSPNVFWGVVASMYVGNVLLLILNLPIIPIWVRILRLPYAYLASIIVLLTLIGAYSINNSTTDMYVVLLFGLLGILMKRFEYEPAPLVLAFVLGPLMETALRRSLVLSEGSFTIFVGRPISAALLGTALLLILASIVSRVRLGQGLAADE